MKQVLRESVQNGIELFRHDAARWVRPQQIAELSELSPTLIIKLLVRHPPLRAMGWFRLATALKWAGVRGVPAWIQRRLLRVYGLELSPGVQIGGGMYIAHPVGCVLMAHRIGANVTVVGQATFGTRGDTGWPYIEDDVFVGVGARILGGVTVGAQARVAANAVVLADVDPGATVVGIPARKIEPRR